MATGRGHSFTSDAGDGAQGSAGVPRRGPSVPVSLRPALLVPRAARLPGEGPRTAPSRAPPRGARRDQTPLAASHGTTAMSGHMVNEDLG